jgi:hypothetical protein
MVTHSFGAIPGVASFRDLTCGEGLLLTYENRQGFMLNWGIVAADQNGDAMVWDVLVYEPTRSLMMFDHDDDRWANLQRALIDRISTNPDIIAASVTIEPTPWFSFRIRLPNPWAWESLLFSAPGLLVNAIPSEVRGLSMTYNQQRRARVALKSRGLVAGRES